MDGKQKRLPQLKEFQEEFKGKVALVTGASGDIGRVIALYLAARGANLVLHGRRIEKLQAVADQIVELGASCSYAIVDVRDEKAVAVSIAELAQKGESPDILVNNAGIYRTAPVLGHQTKDWEEIIDTNLKGAFFYSRAVLEKMIERRWGRIINISSISGKTAEMHGAAYSASKFGLIGFTQALALESATKGVTVNAVCPGWVEGALAAAQLSDPVWCNLNSIKVEESLEIARFSVPQERFIDAAEVAALTAYLASEAARGITGQSINVCGGMCFV